MSIGTAMVIIAIGVFFYLKPQAFKVSGKVGAVVVGLAFLGVAAYYGIYKYREANGDAQKLADYIRQLQPKDDEKHIPAPPPGYQLNKPLPPGTVIDDKPIPATTVDISDMPAFSALCKNRGLNCDPWERDWSKSRPLVGFVIDKNGFYLNGDGSVMTGKQYDAIYSKVLMSEGFCSVAGKTFDQFDDHPKFRFKCNDGYTHELTGPKGSTYDQAIIELVKQQPWLRDPIVGAGSPH